MTSTHLRNSLSAVLAFTVAATLIAGSAFAADGGNGKFKRRGNNGQLNTGTFQIVVPKADRGGSGRQVAKFVAPKADRGNGGNPAIITIPPKANRTTAQFVAPKADRGKTGSPTTLFSVSPKAPRTGNGPTVVKFVAPKAPRGDSGSTTAQIVAPKAPRGDGPIVATAEPPKLAAPQLLAPASAPTPVKVEQAVSAPAPAETKAAPVVAASETPAPAPAVTEASASEVELAYVRAAQRYGYGDYAGGYQTYDQGYDDTYTGGSYGDDGCY
jgi:hypothetical protein